MLRRKVMSRVTSFIIVTRVGLDNRRNVVLLPERAKDFSLHQNVQKCSGVQTAAYSVG